MAESDPPKSVVNCTYCGFPYPMTELQREVYRGRTMGCMNCGRPFAVPAPALITPTSSGDNAQHPVHDSTSTIDSPTEIPAGAAADGTSAIEADGNQSGPGHAAPSPRNLRPNPVAIASFGCAVSFFVLIAAAAVVSALTADQAPASSAPSQLVPRSAEGILVSIALVSASIAVVLGLAALARTRAYHGPTGLVRTAGRGFAIAGLVLGGGGLAITSLLLATVMPMVHRQHELARREACKANLQAISAALANYANANAGHYPDSLAALVQTGSLLPAEIVCPSTTDSPAPGATPPAQAAALATAGHQSYLYAGKGLTADAPRTTILLYEPSSNHRDVAHILFVDGLIIPAQANQADTLGQELAARQNPGATAALLHP